MNKDEIIAALQTLPIGTYEVEQLIPKSYQITIWGNENIGEVYWLSGKIGNVLRGYELIGVSWNPERAAFTYAEKPAGGDLSCIGMPECV